MLLEQPSVEKTKHELYVRVITKNIACFFYNFNRVYENKYRFSKLHSILNAYKIITAPKELNNVKFVYTPTVCENNGLEKMPKMEFRKDGKEVLSIEAEVQNLCFVEEVWADKKNNKIRLIFTPYNFEGKNFDWRTKLLDLKGDGDYRYLVIADYHTGTAEGDMKGYIIDVKDNFKRIATIPIGEAFNLPYTNPKLDFTLL